MFRTRRNTANDVLPPLNNLDEPVSQYFDQLYFFENDRDRNYFKKRVFPSEVRRVLAMPLKEFFQTAREKEKNGMESLQLFFLMNLRLLRPDRVLDAYKKWKDEYGIGNLDDGEAVNQIRLVSVGFQIKDSHLSHRHDLLCLSDHIKGVFKLYDNIDERKLHLGPYFCFVQSSGMGKTKLLYEYKRISSADHVASFLIVPKASIEKDSKENKDVFDFYLDLKLPKAEANTMLANARKAAESIFTYLDGMVKELIRKKKRKS